MQGEAFAEVDAIAEVEMRYEVILLDELVFYRGRATLAVGLQSEGEPAVLHADADSQYS